MKRRRVRFTATAQRHVRREKLWWLENRVHPELVTTEIEDALRLLAVLPGAGTLYTQAGVPNLHRVYLRKLTCHIYYTFDEQEIIIRALWSARRQRGPSLRA